MNESSANQSFFGRLGTDFRSARTYLSAGSRIKKLSAQKKSTISDLSAAYLEIGKQAEQAGLCCDLPAFGPVKEARDKLNEAQDVLAKRSESARQAIDDLDAATKEHTGIIVGLENEYKPLLEKQASATGELSSARRNLSDIEGRLARNKSELASLGSGAISADPLDALKARLGEANQELSKAQADLTAAQQAAKDADKNADTASDAFAHAEKNWRKAESHLQKELSSAQALTTPDKDQKTAAAKEILDRQTTENNRIIAELQEKLTAAKQVQQDRAGQLGKARAQTNQAQQKVQALKTSIRAKELTGEISNLETSQAQAKENLDKAQKSFDQARSAAENKAAELVVAKNKWNKVRAEKEGLLSAANNARAKAEQAVQAAQSPLADAQLAFGRAVYESPNKPTGLETALNKAKELLAAIDQIDTEINQLQIVQDANRGGAKRTLFVGLSAAGILIILAAGIIALASCLSDGKNEKKGEKHNPASQAASKPSQSVPGRTNQPGPAKTNQNPPARNNQPAPERTTQPAPARTTQPATDKTTQPATDRTTQPATGKITMLPRSPIDTAIVISSADYRLNLI